MRDFLMPNAQCPMPNAQCPPLLVTQMQERVLWCFSSCTLKRR
ncbi:MAG: hypothetical protein RMY29_030035 [Nostoc sp. CreGUA01]|nr:hypothetical protein [Nostoc sp. CreGUA01]